MGALVKPLAPSQSSQDWNPPTPTTNLHFPQREAISSMARPKTMEPSTSLRTKPFRLKKPPSIRELPSLRSGNSSNGKQVR
jgi:hypothetical protein